MFGASQLAVVDMVRKAAVKATEAGSRIRVNAVLP